MSERPPLVLIGDHRDIPLSLGLIVITWNAAENSMRTILRCILSQADFDRGRLVEPLIVEAGAVGLVQALNCAADEFPEDAPDVAEAIRAATTFFERVRPYRNYYVHGVNGVTSYGLKFDDEAIESDLPISEMMEVGPFAQVYVKSGKHKSKFGMDWVERETLSDFNNLVADFVDYLQSVEMLVSRYLRGVRSSGDPQLPKLPPMPDPLRKPAFDHPKLKPSPALKIRDPNQAGD